jgi:hypothetical protein
VIRVCSSEMLVCVCAEPADVTPAAVQAVTSTVLALRPTSKDGKSKNGRT